MDTAKTSQVKTRAELPMKAREMLEQLNVEAANHNIWIRTQMNSPAQRPWFSATEIEVGTGQLAPGKVGVGQLKTLPYRWRWQDYRKYLDLVSSIAQKADVSPIEFADRQSILLLNPGLNGRLQVTNTIRCAISIYNTGDVAPAHVHSPNASRTILSDKGGYTTVEGERCEASRGDLILTPNGTWHDHGNDDKDPVIWIDMLDWPLIEFLDCAWVDLNYTGAGTQSNSNVQKPIHADGYSIRLYGHGGMVPTFVSHQLGNGNHSSPLIHFRGVELRDRLHGLRKEKGDPYEGIMVNFVNPVTGKPVFTTMNYTAQMLRPGEQTQLKRETSSTFVLVIEGHGRTEIGDQSFDWEPNDILVMPNFLWRRHINKGKDYAILYTVSDSALLRNIGHYRAQGRNGDNEVVQLVQ
jgi:gentisate 1,2-dioxygenase